MTEIKIPVSTMGTPLTEEELKSIVGGNMDVTRTCICYLSFKDGTTSSTSVAAESEEDCTAKCLNNCNMQTSCRFVIKTKYSAETP